MAKKVHFLDPNKRGVACGASGDLKFHGVVTCKNCMPGLQRALGSATYDGDMERVVELLEYGADPFWAFVKAVNQGHENIVGLFLDRAEPGDVETAAEAGDAIRGAVRGNQLEIAKLLLDRGFKPTVKAMEDAAKKGYLDMVKLLFERGGDPSLAVKQAVKYNRKAILQYLLVQKVDPSPGLGPATDRYSDKLEIVTGLMDHGADVHFDDDIALRNSAARGYSDTVRYLLNLGANVQAKNNSALRNAIEGNYPEIVKLLLDHGADVNDDVNDAYGNPCYMVATAMHRNAAIAALLLKKGADPLKLPSETQEFFSNLSVEQFTEIKSIISINEVMAA